MPIPFINYLAQKTLSACRLLMMTGLFLSLNLSAKPSDKQAFTAEALVKIQRISNPQVSPDGQFIAYVLRSTDMQANKGRTDLWITDIKGQKQQQLTRHLAADYSPIWSKDGQSIYFISNRSGSSQVWNLSLANKNLKQITNFALDVTSFKLSNEQDRLLFSARIFPDCVKESDHIFECSANKKAAEKNKKSTGKLYKQMFVRHWDRWLDDSQSQLFVVDLTTNGIAGNKMTAVSAKVNASVPSNPFGGSEEYNFSLDGKSVFFSARIQNAQEPSSTNFDIYQVDLNKALKTTNLTKDNLAWDSQPIMSPDGKYLAYLAMKRPGFESDKKDLILFDLAKGKKQNLTANWDRSFSSFAFSKDGKSVYLNGNHLGTKVIWRLDLTNKSHQQITQGGYVSSFAIANNSIVYLKDSLKHPSQIFVSQLDGSKSKMIVSHNQDLLATTAFGDYQQFAFNGWNNEKVYGYIIKPAHFDENKRYPLAFLIHGGPQGSFGDHFHYRWNPQTYTGQGYVVVMIDFHGSTGYGQAFTDSISGNWGSKPLEDLKKGLGYALKTYPFIDGNNACALGASYGGYMINWIESHWQNQFKCLVNHDGIFDNRMMYYATEELWFVEWENGGPYFQQPENHEKYNPVNYVTQWKTPMFVIQGGLDYRIPETQSLATFTALQKLGIDSQLLYFPDENHWVLSPHNSLKWHHEVNLWLKKYLTENKKSN